MRILFLAILATAAAFFPSLGRADSLVTYPFSNGTLSGNPANGVTASGFSAGSSKAVVTTSGTYAYILITQQSTTASAAVSNSQYGQFTIQPPTGNGMQMQNIQIVAGRGGQSTPRGIVIRWSLDGYSSNLGTTTLSQQWPSTKGYSFPLNAFTGGPVTFRIYAYAPNNSGIEQSVRFQSITVTGSYVYYAPTVTPSTTNASTTQTSYTIRGTAWSSVGVAAVKVAKNNVNGNYVAASGTTSWEFNAKNLKVGTNVFYVVSADTRGTLSTPVKVIVQRKKTKAATKKTTGRL